MWLLKACFLLILPEPVTLKRFLALDFVFILGIIPKGCGLTLFLVESLLSKTQSFITLTNDIFYFLELVPLSVHSPHFHSDFYSNRKGFFSRLARAYK